MSSRNEHRFSLKLADDAAIVKSRSGWGVASDLKAKERARALAQCTLTDLKGCLARPRFGRRYEAAAVELLFRSEEFY